MNALDRKRDALGRAIAKAQEINKTRGITAAEKNERFERAMADVRRLKSECEALEGRSGPILARQIGGEPERDESFRAAHSKAFRAFLKYGPHAAEKSLQESGATRELHALMEGSDDLGGFSVPDDFRAEVLRMLPGYAVVLAAGARVVMTSGSAVVWPSIRSGSNPYSSDLLNNDEQVNSNWKREAHVTGGAAVTPQSKPTWAQERIPVHLWQCDPVELSNELIEDSSADIGRVLQEVIAETLGLDSDWAFLRGDGNGKPEGVLESGATATTVVYDVSDTTALYNGMVDLWTSVPAQYRGRSSWVMSSAFYGHLLKLEDTAGNHVINPNTTPDQLWTRPIFFSEFMPGVGSAGNKCVILGDFSQFIIAERTSLTVQRLVERFAPNVAFLPRARLGGQVVRKEAFKIGITQA